MRPFWISLLAILSLSPLQAKEQLLVLNLERGTFVQAIDLPPEEKPTAFTQAPDGSILVATAGTKDCHLWKRRLNTPWKREGNLPGEITTLAFSPDGNWLLAKGGPNLWLNRRTKEFLLLSQKVITWNDGRGPHDFWHDPEGQTDVYSFTRDSAYLAWQESGDNRGIIRTLKLGSEQSWETIVREPNEPLFLMDHAFRLLSGPWILFRPRLTASYSTSLQVVNTRSPGQILQVPSRFWLDKMPMDSIQAGLDPEELRKACLSLTLGVSQETPDGRRGLHCRQFAIGLPFLELVDLDVGYPLKAWPWSGGVSLCPDGRHALQTGEVPFYHPPKKGDKLLTAVGMIRVKGPRGFHREWLGHAGDLCSLDLSPDGEQLVTAGDDGWVHVWEVRTQKALRSWLLPGVRSVHFLAKARWVAAVNDNPHGLSEPSRGRILDVASGSVLHDNECTGPRAFHPLSPWLFEGGKVLNLETGETLLAIPGVHALPNYDAKGHLQREWAMAGFSPDGYWLHIVQGSKLSLVSTQTWEVSHTWERPTLKNEFWNGPISFSKDGRYLRWNSYSEPAGDLIDWEWFWDIQKGYRLPDKIPDWLKNRFVRPYGIDSHDVLAVTPDGQTTASGDAEEFGC